MRRALKAAAAWLDGVCSPFWQVVLSFGFFLPAIVLWTLLLDSPERDRGQRATTCAPARSVGR